MTTPRSPFGLPRSSGTPGAEGGAGGAGSSGDGGDAPPAPGFSGDAGDERSLSIRGVRGRSGEEPGEIIVELDTTRGQISGHFTAVQGGTGVALFLGGAGGSVRGPAHDLYVRLAQELSLAGISSLRMVYRHPADFEECLLDALAGCSFLKGLGAERVVIVGHSFGGAVAIRAGQLASIVTGVCALSSQRHGAQEVDRLGKPLLLIHGSTDEVLDAQASRDIFERAREPKRLVILDGSGHALAEHVDEVHDLVDAFIREHVSDTATT